uniref:Uncharacterized protein n=1 Tax=Oryza brachyantha TaxID=4533 RepID=J3N7A9_ORYBR
MHSTKEKRNKFSFQFKRSKANNVYELEIISKVWIDIWAIEKHISMCLDFSQTTYNK